MKILVKNTEGFTDLIKPRGGGVGWGGHSGKMGAERAMSIYLAQIPKFTSMKIKQEDTAYLRSQSKEMLPV